MADTVSVPAFDLQPGDVLILQRRGPGGSVVSYEAAVTDVTEQGPDVRIDVDDPDQVNRSDGGRAVVITKRAYELVAIANA